MSSDEKQRKDVDGRLVLGKSAGDARTSEGELHLVVMQDGLIVTMPGTDFAVEYRKVREAPWLLVAHLQDDPDASISQAEFLAQAWSAASDKARELGWSI